MMRNPRKMLTALALVAVSVLAACGGSDDGTAETSGGESAAVSGKFERLAGAPAGYSKVAGEAELDRADGGTTVSIALTGLEPKTSYIAHLHTGGCGQADPGGPHFQFEKGGSDEPPNEIHLGFTSDASGRGEAEASSKREVPVGEAGSVVLHLDDSHHEMTASDAGASGPSSEEVRTVFVHEGEQHEGEGGVGGQPHSDKIACAELEGASPSEETSAAEGDVPTIVVRDGEAVGGIQELEFSAGEDVRFRVSSDEAEEIHVHGYDISQVVPAGGVIEFDFPADLEGIYEAELEELGVQIAELRINP